MKNAIEAINELVRAINIAQSRGTYSLKESHDAYVAVDFLNSAVANQIAANQAAQTTEVEVSGK